MILGRVSGFPLPLSWLKVRGQDRLRFLNGMLTSDLKTLEALPSPAGCSAFMLSLKGKFVSPLFVLKQEKDSFDLALPQISAQSFLEEIQRRLVADDVEFSSQIPPFEVCVVPQAQNLVESFLPAAAPKSPEARDRVYPLTPSSFGFFLPSERLGAKGAYGFFPRHEEVQKRGEITLMSPEDFTRFRMEVGLPLWGQDYTQDSLVIEFPHSEEISFYKGCYIGQEVVARATYRGHANRVWTRFHSEHAVLLDYVYSPEDPDRPVGKITSALEGRGLGLLRTAYLNSPSSKTLFQKKSGEVYFFSGVEGLL